MMMMMMTGCILIFMMPRSLVMVMVMVLPMTNTCYEWESGKGLGEKKLVLDENPKRPGCSLALNDLKSLFGNWKTNIIIIIINMIIIIIINTITNIVITVLPDLVESCLLSRALAKERWKEKSRLI